MKKLILSVTLSLAALYTLPASAEVSPAGNGQAAAQVNPAQQRVGEIQSELNGIWDKAFKENPDLVKAADETNAKLKEKASEIGYDPNVMKKALVDAQTKLADQDVSDEQRQEVMASLKETKDDQAEIRAKFLADPEVRKLNEDLQEKVMAAMKEVDPKTEQLISEMDSLLASMKSS
ncbi:hypothetical protein M1D72_07600 [Vibrio sp. AK197]|uniref:Uncharacterized protein n=1 Tax=Vibrio olivae TaxID=1243002 RepID=A0ABV5HUW6_9VIBR